MKRVWFAAAVLGVTLALGINFPALPQRATPAAVTRLLVSDMSKPSEALPQGVPAAYDWATHPRVKPLSSMLSFAAFTAWGQLYQCVGTSGSPGYAVDLRDLQSWVFPRTAGRWRRLQSASDLQGAAFPDSYAGPAVAAQYLAPGSGGTTVKLRPGYNFHFWPTSGRVSLQASDVVALVVTPRARLDSSRRSGQGRPCFVLSVGGDLWSSLSAQPSQFSQSGDVGIGRFKRITRSWRLFTMSTAPPGLLKSYPLPLITTTDEDY